MVQSNISCSSQGEVRWSEGGSLYNLMKEAKVMSKDGNPELSFDKDGSKENVELKILNLQPVGATMPKPKFDF